MSAATIYVDCRDTEWKIENAVIENLLPLLVLLVSGYFFLSLSWSICTSSFVFPMASVDPLQRVFENARREFQQHLPAGTDISDILAATSIGQVHTVIKNLQTAQEKSGKLRHLSRIEPFLLRLSDLAGVIEVFVQVKPDILALLWGPIKLILLWTSEWQQGYDAIVKTIERIGELLPRFNEIATHFVDQERIQDIIALFYRDILDFYREIFSFFALPRKLDPGDAKPPGLVIKSHLMAYRTPKAF